MTLLITAVTPEYSLSNSDQRITVAHDDKIRTVDENFNKHIYFGTDEFVANVSYTGVAQWQHQGKTVRLYDIISNAIAEIVPSNPKFAPLSLHVITRLLEELHIPIFVSNKADFELHFNCRHKSPAINSLFVISTFRKSPPWSYSSDTDYVWDYGSLSVFAKVLFEGTEVIFGGAESFVSSKNKHLIRSALNGGADAFDASRIMTKITREAADLSSVIGPSSSAIVIPAQGMVDVNLLKRNGSILTAFLPQMVFSNGSQIAATHLPIDIAVTTEGQLPKHSLFFKSVVAETYKRRDKRRVFRLRSGPIVPGPIGLIGLILFGSLPDEFDSFGLSDPDD